VLSLKLYYFYKRAYNIIFINDVYTCLLLESKYFMINSVIEHICRLSREAVMRLCQDLVLYIPEGRRQTAIPRELKVIILLK